MVFKFFILAAFVAIARASYIAQPVTYAQLPVVKTVVNTEYDHNPQYAFAYDVEDPFTGDSKSQFESRNGDVVRGQYALNDADGTRRTVDYTADAIHGFNAVVQKTPIVKAAVVKSVPVVHQVASPAVSTYAYPAPASPVVSTYAYPSAVSHLSYTSKVAPVAYTTAYAYPQPHSTYGVPYIKDHHYY